MTKWDIEMALARESIFVGTDAFLLIIIVLDIILGI